MPVLETKPLVSSLQQEVTQMIALVKQELLPLEEDVLNYKPQSKAWSAYECLEHLNLVHAVYLKQLKDSVKTPHNSSSAQGEYFKPGFFGNKMVGILKPATSGKVQMPMPTFDMADPSKLKSSLNKEVIERFLKQLDELTSILDHSLEIDWEKKRITSLIGKVLQFKFGDALRFVIAHNQRHLLQAQKAIAHYSK